MDSQTVRTALGTLQTNPDAAEAWTELRETLQSPAGDLTVDEVLDLLRSAGMRHGERGEWSAASKLLGEAVEVARGTDREEAHLAAHAKVLVDQLFNDQAAEAVYRQLLELAPGHEVAQAALLEAEDKKAKWEELAASYAAEAEGATDDAYQSAMLMRAAEVELRFADEPRVDSIAESLERAVRLDPANAMAGKMLELVYRRGGRFEEAARVLERLADRSEDPDQRTAAGIRLARLYLNQLSDPERAARAYDRVLLVDPRQADALSYVTDFYSQNERWDELVRVFERQLEGATEDPEKLGEMLQIAMLQWKMRQAHADAEIWFERIRKLDPANDGMLAFYREYKASLEDDAGLAQVLQGAMRSMADDDPRKAEIASELERLAESQVSAQKNVEYFKARLRENPDDVEARDELKHLYKQTQGHNALVELLRQQLDRTPDEEYETRLEILREIAGVYREYVKSDTALVSVLNQIVQLDGKLDEHDIGEVRELVSLYEKLGRWRDLLTNQQLLAELVPDADEKKKLYREVARRWLDQFSNVQHAMEAYAALHALDPSDEEAIERLEELYRKRRAWAELYSLYEHQLGSKEGAERIPVLREMGQLAAERLQRGDDAVRLYREVLDLDPSRSDVLDKLEKHAERSKDWSTLADALERRLQLLSHDTAKLGVLTKLGAVYADHLEDQEKSIGAWRRILDIEPKQPRAMRVLRDAFLRDGDYDGLEELYASQQDLEGLAEVLSNAADRSKDAATRIDLSYRAARVYEESLGQPDRAFRSYERVLSTDPTDARAAGKLLALYEADEKWARMPALYEVLLENADDEAAKVEVLSKLVEVTGQRLNDRRSAAGYARRAYELSPADPRALELLEQTSRAAGNFDEMTSALEARLVGLQKEAEAHTSEPPPSPDNGGAPTRGRRRRRRRRKSSPEASAPPPLPGSGEARTLTLKLAKVYFDEQGRTDDAVEKLKLLLAEEAGDRDAASALDAILRRENRREDLGWLFELRASHAEGEARAEILDEWAALEEEKFGSSEQALIIYRKALEAFPEDPVALASVARLSRGAEDFISTAAALEKQRDLASGVDRGEKELELAELYKDRLSRPNDALRSARAALELGADRMRAIALLQRLLDDSEVRADSARILSEQYASTGDSRQEAAALHALAGETTDPEEQVPLYHRLVSVFEEKLEEFGAALGAALEGLTKLPGQLDLWDRADALATLSGRPTDLADRYREALRGDLPVEVRRELAQRAARLHEEVLDDPLGAVPHYEKLLEIDPEDGVAFARLKEILTAAEKWSELEALYNRETERLDDPVRRAELFSEVAMIADEIIDDPQKAARYYEQILSLDPAHVGALQALDRIYGRLERYEELSALLERRLEVAAGDEVNPLKVRYARLSLDLLKPQGAIGPIEDVLSEQPNDYDAREVAEQLLEIGSVRLRAARALEAVYEARDETRDLVRVLSIRIEELRPSEDEKLSDAERQEREDERRDILRRVATLRDDRLHDDEGSFDVFAELAPLDPLDAELRERLADSGRRLGRNQKVAEVLVQTADAADTPPLKAEILMDVARIHQELLGDLESAERTYQTVLELDPEDPAIVLPAARALEGILAAGDRPEQLVEVLQTQVPLEQDVARRQLLLARVGELSAEVLGDVPKAIEAWEMRLQEDPDDVEALRALDDLYTRAERYADLVGVLERRRDLATDDGARRELLARQARLQKEELAQPAAAIDAYQMLLDEYGPEVSAFVALEKLFHDAERWEELNDTYERHADIVPSDSERLELLALIGDLRRQHLLDFAGAFDAYRQSLTIDSSHEPSRKALEALLEHEDPMVKSDAAEILHPIYETESDHARLLRVVELEAEVSDDPVQKLEKLDFATRLAEDALEDAERAYAYAARAVRAAAGVSDATPYLDTLDRLARTTSRRADQVAVLEAVAPEIFDADLQLAVTRRVAEIARHELQDEEKAKEFYQKALELRSDDVRSLQALEELHAASGDSQSLLQILERRGEVAESEDERTHLAYRRAELLAGELADRPRAIEVYESILDVGLEARAVDAVERLYAAEERWDDIITLTGRRIDDGKGDEASLRVKLAQIVADRQGDYDRALDELEQALERDTQHDGAVALLEKVTEAATEPHQKARAAGLLEPVYMVRADYDRVMAALETRLGASEDPEERRELITRLAQIHEEQKEDYSAALEISSQLLSDDLGDQATIHELERLAKVAGEELRLAEIFSERLAKVDVDDEASSALARRAGELFAQQGHDTEALGQYRRASAFTPEDENLFNAIDAILVKKESHAERVELHRNALDHRFEPADRIRLLHTIAALQEKELGEIDEAIETHRAVLETDESDVSSLDALTALFEKTERWDDLAELYQRRAENVGPEQGAEYRLALAELFLTRLGAPERGVDQLEEIVRDVPEQSAAIRKLEELKQKESLKARVVDILRPLYESADDWSRLIKLNEDRFVLAEDPGDKVVVLRETAELWESRGDDPKRARRVLAEALRLEPDEPDSRAEYERLVEVTGQFDELARVYSEILDSHPDLLSKRDYLSKLANVYDKRLDDPRSALRAFRGLHQLEQSELEPVQSMENLALLLSDWPALVEALVAKADLVFDDEERAAAWRRVGEVRRFMLEDTDGAVEAYERAFELDQADAPTSDRLIELYEQKGDPARLVDLYMQRVDIATEDENELKFQLLLRAATRFEADLSDRPRAIESLSQALAVRPGDGETLTQLNRLYRAEEMWSELLDNLKLEANTTESADTRIQLRKEVGRILADKLQSQEEAIDAYRLVLEERPGDKESLDAVASMGREEEHLRQLATDVLVPVLRQTSYRRELVDALEMRLSIEIEPRVRAETLRTIAQVQESELESPREAFSTLLRVLGERPDAQDVHADIERLARETGEWEEYVDALEEKGGESFDPEVGRDLFVRAGRLAEEQLSDLDRAITAYSKAAEHAGDRPELLDALERLHQKKGNLTRVRDILERRMAIEDAEDVQAELSYRIGRLLLDELDQPEEALAALRGALERDVHHQGASDALESLLGKEELWGEVFGLLEDIYRDRPQTDRLASLYERRVERASSPEERIDMRRELSRVLEDDCNDPSAAQRVLQLGLLDDVSDTGLHDEIERLARLTGDWSGAAAALTNAVESVEDISAEAAFEMCVRAGTWQRDRASDLEGAERAFAKAWEFNPDSDDVLADLERLQQGEGRERDLIATLGKRAKLALDEDARLGMYRRSTELAERVGDSAVVEEVLREVLDLDDANLWALERLTDVRRAAGDRKETHDLLLRRIELEMSGAALRAMRLEAAEIARDHLGQADEATALFERLFEDDPTDRAAAEALTESYTQAERWDELGAHLERLIDVSTDGEERNRLRVELARLCSSQLGEEDRAIDLLKSVLADDVTRTDAVVALSELYEALERNRDLAELIDTQIEAARERGDTDAELTYLVRLGALYDTQLDDTAKAVETYRAVLERDAEHRGALDALVRLHEAANETTEAAAALERLLPLLPGDEALTRTVELAGLYQKIGDGEAAAGAFERALALDPQSEEVRVSLRAQYEENGRWDKVAELLVSGVDPAADAKTKVKVFREAASIQAEKAGDHGAAADLLARASELVPDDRELLLELCDEYSASGRGAEAAEVLEKIVESFGGKRSKELGEIHRRLATAYLSQDEKDKALEQLDKAFRIEPGNVYVLKQLGEVALEQQDYKKAQQMFRALLLQRLGPKSPITKAQALLRLGQVHQAQGEKPKAKQMYERALQADASLEEAKALLESL